MPEASETDSGTRWRFGPFVLDERERRLSAGEQPIELTAKSFETLLYLVRNPGRLVARRELLDAVWPDAVVEEGNLHWTVSAVRKALAAHDPDTSYIETVRGFGYRLAQPVTPETGLEPARAAEGEERASAPGSRPARAWHRILIGSALAVLLAGLLFAWFRTRRPATPERTTLVVAGFRNLADRPEDAWLGTALAEMLTVDLARGGLRTLPGDEVARMRRDLQLSGDGPFSRETLERIGRNADAGWVVSGSYLVLPGAERRVRLDARLDDARSGETLATASHVASESDLFELVGATGDELNRALGKVRRPAEAGARPALPAEPVARRAYAEGLARLRLLDARGAVPLLEKAAAAAPDFGGIPLALSRALSVLGDDERAAREALRAQQMAAGFPERERLAVEANAFSVARRWDSAIAAWSRLQALEPEVPEHALGLAEAQLLSGGFQDALGTLEALGRRLPVWREHARVEWLISTAHAQMDNHVEALEHARRAVELARRQESRELQARGLLREAFALPRVPGGTLDEGIAAAREARRLAEASGDRNLLAKSANILGTLFSEAEDSDSAERMYRESLALHRELGSQAAIESVLFNLAVEATARGDLRAAQGWFEQEHLECRATNSSVCEARALAGLGENRLYRGELAAARALLEQALEGQRTQGNRNRQAEVLALLAQLELWAKGPTTAEPLLARALALREAAGSPSSLNWARLDLTSAKLEADAATAAERDDLKQTAELAQRGGANERGLEAYARALLAQALLGEGDGRGALRQSARAATLAPLPRHPAATFLIAARRVRVLLSLRDLDGAQAAVDTLQHAAQASGFAAYELEARLLRARLLALRGQGREAAARLRELREECRLKGFGWFVQQADVALAALPAGSGAPQS